MKRPFPLAAFVALCAIIVSRFWAVGETRLNHDEVRSISRTFGSIQQIYTWQPPDWPPLYYLVLGAYRVLVGYHPLIMRVSSVLLFALAAAMVYRAGLALLRDRRAALAGMAAFASLGMVLFMSVNLRGYVLAMVFYPLALWLMVRYFNAARVQWGAGALLGGALAAVFWTTYTALIGYVVFVAYTLLVYPRRMLRWWLPGVVALIVAAPQLARLGGYFVPVLVTRETAAPELQVLDAPVYVTLRDLYAAYAGGAGWVWLGVGVLSALLLFLRERRRAAFALAVLALLGPLMAATVGYWAGMKGTHYSWWATIVLALTAGALLANLPRLLYGGVVAMLLVVPFVPLDGERYDMLFMHDFESNFAWLQSRYQPGDVLIFDPACENYQRCGTNEEWDYYQMVYFPDRRLEFADAPGDHRRIWYVQVAGQQDEALQAAIADGRLRGHFVGPATFLFQLYEAPPNPDGVLFENGMRFHGFEVVDERLGGYVRGPVVRREGEQVRLRLWWSVDAPLALDYSLSTMLAPTPDAPPIAAFDGPPQVIDLYPFDDDTPVPETSRWQPGRYYVEERVISLPADIPATYRDQLLPLYLTVYQWWDGQVIDAPGATPDGRYPLRTMALLAY